MAFKNGQSAINRSTDRRIGKSSSLSIIENDSLEQRKDEKEIWSQTAIVRGAFKHLGRIQKTGMLLKLRQLLIATCGR